MNVVKDYCNLKLYMNTRFYANQNYKVDSIEDFLDTLDTPLTYNKLQYFKVLDVMKELKINCHQADIKDLYKYNYARIEIVNDYSNTEWILYYFVTKINWISSSAVKLTLQLDTLNTFLDRMEFSNRTYIEREHQSRYKKFIPANQTLYKYYDSERGEYNTIKYYLQRSIPFNISEELNPVLYPYTLRASQSRTTMLKGYTLDNKILTPYYYIDTTDASHIKQMRLDLYGTPIVKPFNNYEWSLDYLFDGHITTHSGSGGTTYELIDTNAIKACNWYLETLQQEYSEDETTVAIKYYYIPYFNDERDSYTLVNYGHLKKYDSSLLRVSYVPYGHSSNYIVYDDASTKSFIEDGANKKIIRAQPRSVEFDMIKLGMGAYPDSIFKLRKLIFEELSEYDKADCLEYYNKTYFLDESALYSNEFMNVEFSYSLQKYNLDLGIIGTTSYDSYTDDDNIDSDPFIDIYYATSFENDAAVYFKFNFKYTSDKPLPNGMDSALMFVEANTDISLISSDYIEYMRYGYNYDTKLNDIAEDKEWNNLNKSVESSIQSGTSLNPMKWIRAGQSTATTIKYGVQDIELSNLQRATEMEKTLSVKKGAKISLSSCKGILPLKTTAPMLCYTINAPSPLFREYYRRYFYLYGQKQQEYGIPTHNNRKIFDYLKCKAEFVNRNNAPSLEILTDMIDKLGAGVTFIHKITDSTTPQWIFDFEDKENIEVDLFNYLSSN